MIREWNAENKRERELMKQQREEIQRKKTITDRAAAEVAKMKKDVKIHINSLAERKYNDFRRTYSSGIAIVGIYAFLVTFFYALHSERCISDLGAFCGTLWEGVHLYAETLKTLATSLSDVSTGIPQEIIAFVVHWLLFAVVVLLGAAIPLAALFFGGKWVVKVYRHYCFDELSVLVALVSIAILVFFADIMPINGVLIFVISHVLYIAVRWYLPKNALE